MVHLELRGKATEISSRSAIRILFLLASIAFTVPLGIVYARGNRVFQENCALQLLGAIPLRGVEGRIDHMAVTPDGKQLFVAALGSDMVEKILIERRVVIGNIRDTKEPQGLSYVPKSKRLAVASGGMARFGLTIRT